MSAQERKAVLLRISPELWRELERWAQAELRSINGQIESILREAVARRTAAKEVRGNTRPRRGS